MWDKLLYFRLPLRVALLVLFKQNIVNALQVYLISPQPVFVITCEAVDNYWDGESQDENATEGTQAT